MTKRDVGKQLVELEHSYWQAIKERDWNTALRLSDDPCIVTGPQGVGKLDKHAIVAMMKGAPYQLDEYKLADDITVRMLGDDIGVVAYKVHEKLTVDGKPIELDAAETTTWVRRNGHWVCALHTESIEGDPFGRDRRAN